jgi:aspartyl-tRNA(Asn)/glutamyl-tRNA(Gln) amidotransferase subunit A
MAQQPSPADLTLAQASAAIAGGELSPLELTAACVERAAELEPELRAFVTLDSEGAIAQATALTDELRKAGPRGPLHGIPCAIKDLIDVSGLPTTASSRVLRDNIAVSDAPVVARLREAGAVIIGKTNTQEFAYGVVTAPTRNPWNTACIPGGSSGGSAAAVAAGLSTTALGTDTAGSIRIPSALCGVAGLRPRREKVPLKQVIPLAPSLDACGPIARDVVDLKLVWNELSPRDALSPTTPSGLRVAVPERIEDLLEIDSEVAAAFAGAVGTLGAGGVEVLPTTIPSFKEWDFPRSVKLMVEALVAHQEAGWYPAKAHDYTTETLEAHRYAERLPATILLTSQRKVAALVEEWSNVLSNSDVLALPTTPFAAPTVAQAAEGDEGHRTPVVRHMTRTCGPVNCCNLAAISVPCGFTREGLPVGIQFIGRDEATVLGAGAAYQAMTDWHTRRPTVTASRGGTGTGA